MEATAEKDGDEEDTEENGQMTVWGAKKRQQEESNREIGDKNGDRESGRAMKWQHGLKLKKKSKTRTKMDKGKEGEQREYKKRVTERRWEQEQ